MRKEETIIKKIEEMQKSQYAEHYTVQIGVLKWVLGKASTPRQGMFIERERQREGKE